MTDSGAGRPPAFPLATRPPPDAGGSTAAASPGDAASSGTGPRVALAPGRRPPKLLIESLLIVLSVLLGFAATEWRDRQAERVLADDALRNFRREIRQNLAILDSVYPRHVVMVARLDAAARTPRPGETAFQALVRALPAGGTAVPPLADAAWETAVSTGALRFLGYARRATLRSVPGPAHHAVADGPPARGPAEHAGELRAGPPGGDAARAPPVVLGVERPGAIPYRRVPADPAAARPRRAVTTRARRGTVAASARRRMAA